LYVHERLSTGKFTVDVRLDAAQHVLVEVIDVQGRVRARIDEGQRGAGTLGSRLDPLSAFKPPLMRV
jgi:hypothetical protein